MINRYIFPIFIVLLAIATYQFYIRPLNEEIKAALLKEADVKAALVETDTAQATLDEIAKRYESFPSDAVDRLSEIIPEKVDPIRFLIDTTAFLERKGFPAKSLVVDPVGGESGEGVPVAPYQKHFVTFTISASYDTFREFLHALETSLMFRDPVNVSFTSSPAVGANEGGNPEFAIHDYVVRITSYSLH